MSARPQENPQVADEVGRKLREIDQLLGIRWFERAVFSDDGTEWEGRYGLIVRWPENDPRWEMYRSGDIGEPVDRLGWFTTDPTNGNSVPVDPLDMFDKIIELLARCDLEKTPWAGRMKSVMEGNRAQMKKNEDDFKDEAIQGLMYDRKQMAGESIVSVPVQIVNETPKEEKGNWKHTLHRDEI